jgi:zinc ribbon protein/Sel1 repeat-containing protein
VLCPKCRNDNPADYRFCGMCGTPLDKPATASEPGGSTRTVELSGLRERSSEPPPPVSGPSFLGLNDAPSRIGYGDSSRDVTYLFEDEQPRRTYWRFTLVLIILLGCAGLGWLEYTRSGKSWTAPWSKGPAESPIQASQPAPEEQNPAAAVQPPADSSAPAQKPENAPSAAPPAPAPTPGQPAPAENQSATKEPAAGSQNPPEAQAAAGTKQEKAESASAEKSPSESGSSDEREATEPAKPARPEKLAKSKPKPVPVTSADDTLVANAEKYLYGRGVPQNCDRALSSLRAAAERENLRARSLLGTMYATGHCVPRDLPNAYRWFALASRENADNMWVQRNLEMIWREMTPQERQLATQRSQ